MLFNQDETEKNDNNFKVGSRPIVDPLAEVKPEHLIDDTRAMNMDPMELYTGRQFRLEIWEHIIKTMKVGEIARYHCPYEVWNLT